MELSIIVPVYNMAAENKLSFCLDSLINQNLDDYEIIAVDDCSTDDSYAILLSYKERYPDLVRVFKTPENLRQGGAKNLGLDKARGEWVGFIDSDDWISPDMYGKLLERSRKTGADVVGCDYSLVDKHSFDIGRVCANSRDNQVGELDHDRRKSLILDGGSLCVKIYRKERIDRLNLRFPEGIFYEDNALGNSFLVTAEHFEYVKEPLYYYYQHAASTVHTVTVERCRNRMEACRIMVSEARRLGFYEEFIKEIEYKFTLLFLINTLFSYMRSTDKVDVAFVKELITEQKRMFPHFEDNEYYVNQTNEEEKKYVHLLMRNPLLFVIKYRMLLKYRKIRYKQ